MCLYCAFITQLLIFYGKVKLKNFRRDSEDLKLFGNAYNLKLARWKILAKKLLDDPP